jgi:Ni/Co efflux regulator RcnB
MKRKWFATVFSVAMAAGAVALAQPDNRDQDAKHQHDNGGPAQHGGGNRGGGGPAPQGASPQGGARGEGGGAPQGGRGGAFMNAPPSQSEGVRASEGGGPQGRARGNPHVFGAAPRANENAGARGGAPAGAETNGGAGANRGASGRAGFSQTAPAQAPAQGRRGRTAGFSQTAPTQPPAGRSGQAFTGAGAASGGGGAARGHAGFMANGVARQGQVTFGAPGYRPGGTARPRYNRAYFPPAVTAQQRYQWQGGWTSQPGYYHRHWGYGDYLPHGWYGSNFWIGSYWFYGLPVAPFGFAWVRLGPDAVLVNLYTGLVVEVVYGLFW